MIRDYYKTTEEALESSHFYSIEKDVIEGKCPLFENWNKYTGCTKEEFLEKLKWLYEDPFQYSAEWADPRRSRALLCLWDGTIVRMNVAYYKCGEFKGFYYHDDELEYHYSQEKPDEIVYKKGLKGFRVWMQGKRIEVRTQIVDYARRKFYPDHSIVWDRIEPDGMFYKYPRLV